MKNSVVVLVFSIVWMFVSCKKDRVCSCEVNGSTQTTNLNDIKKKDAEEACDATEASLQNTTDPNAVCAVLDK